MILYIKKLLIIYKGGNKMFAKNDEAKVFSLGEGIESRILGNGGSLMVVENHFEKGALGPSHTHEHEQAGYIAKGKFEFTIDGKKEILNVGDSFYVEANVPHSCLALEDCTIVDIFTPQREDFLKKTQE